MSQPQTTEKESDELFAGINDLRDRYPGQELVQDFALSRSYPAKFSYHRAAGGADPASIDRDIGPAEYVDIAVMILRHLYQMVALSHRGDRHASSEALRAEMSADEHAHPLLRLLWADFDDEGGFDQQSVVRYEILKRTSPDRRTVAGLLESEQMWKTLWSRAPFLLHQQVGFGRLRGSHLWEEGPLVERAKQAEYCRIIWEGQGDLADHIGAYSGRRVDGDNEILFSFGAPAVIRIDYRHAADAPAKTHADLKRIAVPIKRYHLDETDGETHLIETVDTLHYVLIAVVRCAGGEERGDRMRLWDRYGHVMAHPISMKNMMGTYWRLGDPNARFLLFYCPSIGSMTGFSEEEVPHESSMLGTWYANMKGSIPTEQSGDSSTTGPPAGPSGISRTGAAQQERRSSASLPGANNAPLGLAGANSTPLGKRRR
ncbi:hypothetical protein GGR56DRAFT_686940 [Xylariaceae sp. FL0804]|nr:hypothetical protein GGR56DRAFT_686940 [Xylariaceae sp. FL0804]